jgi:hypothetical protein
MKNAIFLDMMPCGSCYNRRFGAYHFYLQDIKIQPARNGISVTGVEGFTAVTMKNGVFWDVAPCGSCKNEHLGGT